MPPPPPPPPNKLEAKPPIPPTTDPIGPKAEPVAAPYNAPPKALPKLKAISSGDYFFVYFKANRFKPSRLNNDKGSKEGCREPDHGGTQGSS